jgi:3-oxoacyl-[acyl-carrier protein] reductase
MLSSYVEKTVPKANSPYIVGKFALLGLMKSLVSEYATSNIQVNAVSPSLMETNFLSNLPELISEMTAQQHPLKRNAMPTDVVPVIRFLLSKESDYINGANISVNGGGL